MKLRTHITTLAIIATLSGAARAELPEGVPVDGKTFHAALIDCNDKWQLTFNTETNRLTINAVDLVCWGTCVEVRRGPLVFFDDGSVLVADVLTVKKQRMTVDSPVFGEVELPLGRVTGVVLGLPTDRRRRDELRKKITNATGRSDCVMLSNGDRITGTIRSIENDSIKLTTDIGSIVFETRRVEAIVFSPDLVQRTGPRGLAAWVGMSDGSLLMASGMDVDAESVGLKVLDGVQLIGSRKRLTFLQPIGGRAVYLSDLKPSEYQFVPYLDLRWPYEVDANVDGGRLRCKNRLYVKGLGVHSDARIVYLLDGSYRRFQAELGIDDSTSGRGSVRARIYVDDRLQHTTEVVRGGDVPVPINVDVSNGKRIDLVVDYADRANVLDRANFLNARFVR